MTTHNTAFYTYASLTTPNHVDISIIVDMLLTIVPAERIAVHAQTVNVTAFTLRESAKLSMLDMPITDDANLLSTPLP